MADNTTLQTTPATPPAGFVIATDDVAGVHFQKVKIDVGGDGVSAILGTANPMPVDDAGGTLTVDAPVVTPVFVRLSNGSSAIATLPVSVASIPSHAVTNAGTFAVQATGTVTANAGTGTMAVSLASLPALAAGTNNIGDIDVLTSPKASTVSAAAQTSQGTTAAQILASNASRKQFMVQNTGTTVIKLSFSGTDPTATAYHVALAACAGADDGSGGTYISDLYTGVVKAVSSASGGTLVVTEIS